jgi:carboxypeptidase Taq
MLIIFRILSELSNRSNFSYNKNMKKLRKLLNDLHSLNSVSALLSWDQETNLPNGAIDARSEQSALISKYQHELHTSTEFETALKEVVDTSSGKINESVPLDEQRLVTCVYEDWKIATSLPTKFVSDFSKLTSKAQHIWQEARDKNDFSLFAPYLKQLVEMSKEKAAYIDKNKSPYDVLLNEYEEGITANDLKQIFEPLRKGSVELLKKIQASSATFHDFSTSRYDEQKQWDFGVSVLTKMGYDFNRGRQDKSTHPFTIDMGSSDVRITTRFKGNDFMDGLSSTIHEGGHALYEQGLDSEWAGTPYSESVSLGIHESQSRLWEKIVGQSTEFWTHFYPKFQTYFPQLNEVGFQEFYRSINQVKPGFIRVEADELTYNLHILIRFEIEEALFNGDVDIERLPDLWNQKYKDYLGVTVEKMSDGILQDVHWSCGLFGYFPTYTLGNLYSVMLFEQLEKELPTIKKDIESGDLGKIREWCDKHVYKEGRRFTPKDLIRKITGKDLTIDPFLNHLKRKYSAIYSL